MKLLVFAILMPIGLQTLSGQVTGSAGGSEATFEATVQPILAKRCYMCHSDKLKTANLSLEAYRTGAMAVKQPEVWDKVLDKLLAKQMPPPPLPAPTQAEMTVLTGWIENALKDTDFSRQADPGRMTARRLNRTEYNNTVRDLLGVAMRPADEFPVDDSGYGFDNIGDVLSMSPLLMEKYMAAAKRISSVAIYGEKFPPKAEVLDHLMGKRTADLASGGLLSNDSYLPFSMRGALYGSVVLPVDAEYEFRVRMANYRGFGNGGVQSQNGDNLKVLKLPLVEVRPLMQTFVKALGAQNCQFCHIQGDFASDNNPKKLTARKMISMVMEANAKIDTIFPGGKTHVTCFTCHRGASMVPTSAEEEEAQRQELALHPAPARGAVDAKARLEAARKAFPPVKIVLTLDGKPILTDFSEGNSSYEYSRGELTVRVRVKAGEHMLRASFPELADLKDPRDNIDYVSRRLLYVDYLNVVGPFNPSTEPPESYKRIFICGQNDLDCARKIVENLERRAYRRPVTQQEIESKVRLVAMVQKKGDTFEEGIRVALQAILVSPDFLFQIHRDPALSIPAASSARLINEYELASRLSYFLWGTMPDEELMHAADEQRLRKPGVLEAEVRRMMADPKAKNLEDNFAAQWLQLRNLGRTKPDPERFPTVDDELIDAMRHETLLFVGAIINEDRSILDFIDAPFTYLNGPLARHYGISGVSGEGFQRVTLDGEQRGGLLTQAAILTVSSYPTRTSPTVRGKWVLENLLGAPPPPPPANVPGLNDSQVGATASLRERMEQHRANPACAVCHKAMDPIGFGLENYDAVGKWRTMDGKIPIDSSGILPDGQSFDGVKGLKKILKAQSEAFTRNLTEKLLTFALGRGLERGDGPTVDQISRDVAANNYRFSSLVSGIVNSAPFQTRSGEKKPVTIKETAGPPAAVREVARQPMPVKEIARQ